MRNSQHCCVFEFFLDKLLDLLLSHNIDICRSFIENDDLVLAQYCPANADKLALSNTQIRTTFTYLKVNAFALFLPFLAVATHRIQFIRGLHTRDLSVSISPLFFSLCT